MVEYIDTVAEGSNFRPICERCKERLETIFVIKEEWICRDCLSTDEKARIIDQFS